MEPALQPLPDWVPRYNYQDYKQWEGEWELIQGVPVSLFPSPVKKHGKLEKRIAFQLDDLIRHVANGCDCEVYQNIDWIAAADTVLRPDISVVCPDTTSDFIEQPPVLVVEVASPSTHLKDRNIKFRLYEKYGVKYYLIAHPTLHTLQSWKLGPSGYEEYNQIFFQLTEQCSISIDPALFWE